MSYDFVEQHDGYTISRKYYEATDARLGRNVAHDSRSLSYQVVADDAALTSVRHTRYIPVLDQGDLGSCTGNAGTGALGTGNFWAEGDNVLDTENENSDESYAVNLYSDATKIDSARGTYPPTDTGSDGLSIAKVLTTRGLISGYQHATSIAAFKTALAVAPVIVGIEWLENMFDPAADGRVSVSGKVAGGHEIVFDELDVENKRAWFTNSWGTSWGVDGRAYLTWSDLSTLLKAEGDVTSFVPTSQPAPTPTPAPDATVVQEIIDAVNAFVVSLENFVKQL